ncbi:Cysteine-rich receptor-like protein kinase 25 [Acorus calamus]|uniref:non-specific serine/threonine protein kinase n=1 Tax=Acorus calamus TaxID=4465 RepID=A0AAV9CI68_ACOCL|nr:Cysteine-rich receptor-like protein kinase 25 [Acorus calamus]
MHLLLYSVSILIHIFTTTTVRAQQDPTYLYCSSTTSNYTSGSQFEANLNRTLQSLTINTPTNNRLYNTSIEGTNDKVYGLAQCRGDLSSQSCQTCLNQSRLNIIKRCSKGKQAAIRYDGCLLRYSDEFFYDEVDSYGDVIKCVLKNMTEPTLFNANVSSLLSEVSQTVSANVSRFSVGATKYGEFFNIYAMGQCMEDLAEGDCYNCLVDMVGALQAKVPATKKEAKILTASCFLWYSTDLFFSLQSLSSPPPSPSPSIVPSSPIPTLTNRTTGNGKTKTSRSVVYVVMSVVISLIVFLSVCLCLWRRKAYKKLLGGKTRNTENTNSLLFDFDTLRVATDDFLDSNKLGEGGFGPVYKGRLPDGEEIAVKMLASDSGQGLEELRNEVVFVAKLQHKNLARLLGCCLGEEKMLVYEYLPNTSLDKYLFDPVKRKLLNWEIRYKIIEGIARGLLYLHEDSQLRIIHRDLKASNILLDGDMNPKISDFGLAKLFVPPPASAAFPSYTNILTLPPKIKLLYEILATSPSSTAVRVTPEDVEDVLKLSYSHPATAIKFFHWLATASTTATPPLLVESHGGPPRQEPLFDAMWDSIKSMWNDRLLSLAMFASIFKSYVSAKRMGEAILTFNRMVHYGIPRNVTALNALHSAIFRYGHIVDAKVLFDGAKANIRSDVASGSIRERGGHLRQRSQRRDRRRVSGRTRASVRRKKRYPDLRP